MPLLVLTAKEASALGSQARAQWPATDETQAERLSPLARPSFSPSFRISPGDLIFTIGSCFARNIEKQLLSEGYNVAISRFRPPSEPRQRADPDTLLHRYIPHSIVNELSWALGPETPFPEQAYVELSEGGWYDLQLHPLAGVGAVEQLRARREAISNYVALAAQAKAFVVTLGLAEAWFDKQCGVYLNAAPPKRAKALFPDRFEFHLLGYEDVLGALEQMHALLARHGDPELRMLVTVSPVALSTTFTGADVMTANTYMKSVLRAAAEAFVRRHERVDYFPSYESVVLSDRSYAWKADQAHVSDELVRLNVLRMIDAYAEAREASASPDQVFAAIAKLHQARAAAARGDVGRAIAFFEAAAEADRHDALLLMEFARYLYEQGRLARAASVAQASVDHGSGPYGGYFHLAQILYAARRTGDAHAAVVKARELQPDRPGVVGLEQLIADRLRAKATPTAPLTAKLGRLRSLLKAGAAHSRG